MSSLIRNEYYYEVLSASELDFLKKKAGKQKHVYQKITRIMLVGAFIISFAGAWKNIEKAGKIIDTETVFSWENYFITLAILIVLFLLALRLSRSSELTQIQKDLRQKTKIIERVTIERKTYLPHNNTFHFYLNSVIKLSIQVDAGDFASLSEGDEISIEYSKNAWVYFGYF